MKPEITHNLIFSYGINALKDIFTARNGNLNFAWGTVSFPLFANKVYELLGNADIISADSRFQLFKRPNTGLSYDIEWEFYLEDLIRIVFTDYLFLNIIIPCYVGLDKVDNKILLRNIEASISQFYLQPIDKYQFEIYKLTKYGAEYIENNQAHIYDREGYITNLKTKIPELDETIEVYFDDALSTFRTNNYRASVILLGGASEKLIKLLRDSIISYMNEKGESPNKNLKGWTISAIFTGIKGYITSNQKNIPNALVEDFEEIITGVHLVIKKSRNEVGHPEIRYKNIGREDAKRYLLLFPDYCERVYKLIEYFKSQQTSN
jgi:hypothetical protein